MPIAAQTSPITPGASGTVHDPTIGHIAAGEKFCKAAPARAWLNAIPP